MMKKNIFYAIIIASLLLSACSAGAASKTSTATATVQPKDSLIAEGHLMPVASMDLSFGIPGQVAEILVKNGDNVSKDQVLVKLVLSSEAVAAVERAKQNVLLAQQTLDNLQASAELNLAQAKQGVVSAQQQVDDAAKKADANATDENKSNLKVAQAKLNLAKSTQSTLEAHAGIDPDTLAAAQAKLMVAKADATSAQAAVDSIDLKSTMSGTVTDLTLEIGQRVTAGQPVITLADHSSWVVKTDNLTENSVSAIHAGQKAVIRFDALPGEQFFGQIQSINSRYELQRGDITYTVTLTLNDTRPSLRWGMTAAVQFVQ